MGIRPVHSPISMNEYWWSVAYESLFPSGIDRDNLFSSLQMLVNANCAGANIKTHKKFMIDFLTGGSMADLKDEDYVTIKKGIKEAKELQKKLLRAKNG